LKRWSALDIKPNAPPTFKCTVCSEWLVFQVRYDVSQFYTVPTSVPPYPLPTKQTFNGVQGKVGYNALLKSSNADFLLGITVGVGELNNTASLTSAQYSNNQITESGTNQLVINQGQKTLYVGKYKTYLGVPINFDAIIFRLLSRICGLIPARVGVPRCDIGLFPSLRRYGSHRIVWLPLESCCWGPRRHPWNSLPWRETSS